MSEMPVELAIFLAQRYEGFGYLIVSAIVIVGIAAIAVEAIGNRLGKK